jgi:hypothetical protein
MTAMSSICHLQVISVIRVSRRVGVNAGGGIRTFWMTVEDDQKSREIA